MGGTYGTILGGNEFIVVVEKPEGKRPFGRPRPRWENYTKIGWRRISWIHSSLIGTIGRIKFEVGNETLVAANCEVILNHLRTFTLSRIILLRADVLLLLFFCTHSLTALVGLCLLYELPGSHTAHHTR